MTACSTTRASADGPRGPIPNPAVDATLATAKGEQTAVLAGGCFWGIEAVFEHVKGVTRVESGYAGGSADTAEYETVSSGRTGHAESVQITYDPSQITYGQLLKVFFAVAHDPTELNRQGPDIGTQYRSAIFYANEEQKRAPKTIIGHKPRATLRSVWAILLRTFGAMSTPAEMLRWGPRIRRLRASHNDLFIFTALRNHAFSVKAQIGRPRASNDPVFISALRNHALRVITSQSLFTFQHNKGESR